VEYTKNGRTKGINVSLLDTEDPENNSFWVVNQLLVKENNNERRFDVVVFVASTRADSGSVGFSCLSDALK
jgi:type I restriction enzyme R subunit